MTARCWLTAPKIALSGAMNLVPFKFSQLSYLHCCCTKANGSLMRCGVRIHFRFFISPLNCTLNPGRFDYTNVGVMLKIYPEP